MLPSPDSDDVFTIRPGALLPEHDGRVLGRREVPLQVYRDHRVPLLLAHVEDHAVAQDACVVDEDVEPPEGVERRLHDALAALHRRHRVVVGDRPGRPRPRSRPPPGRPETDRRPRRPRSRQGRSRRPSPPPSRAGTPRPARCRAPRPSRSLPCPRAVPPSGTPCAKTAPPSLAAGRGRIYTSARYGSGSSCAPRRLKRELARSTPSAMIASTPSAAWRTVSSRVRRSSPAGSAST